MSSLQLFDFLFGDSLEVIIRIDEVWHFRFECLLLVLVNLDSFSKLNVCLYLFSDQKPLLLPDFIMPLSELFNECFQPLLLCH